MYCIKYEHLTYPVEESNFIDKVAVVIEFRKTYIPNYVTHIFMCVCHSHTTIELHD